MTYCKDCIDHLHNCIAMMLRFRNLSELSDWISKLLAPSGNCCFLHVLRDPDVVKQNPWAFSSRPLQSTPTSIFHRPFDNFSWCSSLCRKVWPNSLPYIFFLPNCVVWTGSSWVVILLVVELYYFKLKV
jgi:hypothetical protein